MYHSYATLNGIFAWPSRSALEGQISCEVIANLLFGTRTSWIAHFMPIYNYLSTKASMQSLEKWQAARRLCFASASVEVWLLRRVTALLLIDKQVILQERPPQLSRASHSCIAAVTRRTCFLELLFDSAGIWAPSCGLLGRRASECSSDPHWWLALCPHRRQLTHTDLSLILPVQVDEF